MIGLTALDLPKCFGNQVGDNFCVGFGMEAVAFGFELFTQLAVVFDNAVLNYCDPI